jgi:hypothetical protein
MAPSFATRPASAASYWSDLGASGYWTDSRLPSVPRRALNDQPTSQPPGTTLAWDAHDASLPSPRSERFEGDKGAPIPQRPPSAPFQSSLQSHARPRVQSRVYSSLGAPNTTHSHSRQSAWPVTPVEVLAYDAHGESTYIRQIAPERWRWRPTSREADCRGWASRGQLYDRLDHWQEGRDETAALPEEQRSRSRFHGTYHPMADLQSASHFGSQYSGRSYLDDPDDIQYQKHGRVTYPYSASMCELQWRCYELELSSHGTKRQLLERLNAHLAGFDRAPTEMRGHGHAW